jgi:hypothetical protein
MIVLPSGFSVDIGSDQEHERLVAVIYFRNQYVCTVSDETTPNQFEFEFNPSARDAATPIRRCPLNPLLETLSAAAERLKSMTDI